jgi:hypothetical protein
MTKFHGMITEVDLLRSRIAELEDGACRFNCRKEKEAFEAGWKGRSAISKLKQWSGSMETAYRKWIKERDE